MHLSEIFNQYLDLNRDYVTFINEIINNDFKNHTEEEIIDKLVASKEKYKSLMSETDKVECEEENGIFLKDVKYSIVDGMFLAIDLYNFYKSKELERFKMRGVNYIRKGRVSSFF